MAIPAGSRWWIATLIIIGTLVAISALALDSPDVVWNDGEPFCPRCRKGVEDYSSRCPHCQTDLEWVVTSPSTSPISHASLSLLEAEWVKARIEALGAEAAAGRVAQALGLSVEAGREYLASVSRGDCGFCGGTRKDLVSPDLANAEPCPLCFGTGTSIICGGDRHVSLGDWGAEQALRAYEWEFDDLLRTSLPTETVRAEARRLAKRFLDSHAGTVQAGRIYFWQRLASRDDRPSELPPAYLCVKISRDRLDQALEALRKPE